LPLDFPNIIRRAPRRARQTAPREPTPYRKVIRGALGLGFVAAFVCWTVNPLNLRAHVFSGALVNDFLFVVPVIVASVAIEVEHCRRWGYLGSAARLPGVLFTGLFWVVTATLGYMAGQQPAFLLLGSLRGVPQLVGQSVQVTVAVTAIVGSLGGAALVWWLRIWLSERRRMRGVQLFAEFAEIFAGFVGVLNRTVQLFTALVYIGGGALVLMGLKLGANVFSDLISSYIPYWMQTVATVAGVIAAFLLFAKGLQRLTRAINIRPSAISGPHGAAYTATAADLRRAGILH